MSDSVTYADRVATPATDATPPSYWDAMPPGKVERIYSQKPVVLAHLRTAVSPLTVVEIADAVGRAPVTVRKHLRALIAEGEIAVVGYRSRVGYTDGVGGRGRHVYAVVSP